MKTLITKPQRISRLIVCLTVAIEIIEHNEIFGGSRAHPGDSIFKLFDKGTIPDEFIPLVSRLDDHRVLIRAGFTKTRVTGFLWWKKNHEDVVPVDFRSKDQILTYLREWLSVLVEDYTSQGFVECPKCGTISCEGGCRDTVPAEEHLEVLKSEMRAANRVTELYQALRRHREAIAPFALIQVPETDPDTKEVISGVTAGQVRDALKVYNHG